MTAKRFIEFSTQNTDNGEINNGFYDIETEGWFYTKDSVNARKIVELLNELNEENQTLRAFIKRLTNDCGEIILMNGVGYKVDKILEDLE
jgi:AAA15 family ATPase/GTPase